MLLVLPQDLEHYPQMSSVFVLVLRVYQYVIYKHHHKLVQVGFENSIHKIHKSHRGIGQAKGHHHKFIMTIDVFKFNCKLMVSKLQVNLEKDSRFLQLIK